MRARRRVDRRQGDRRQGDRRKPKPLWQLATVVVAGVFLSLVGVVAYAESQVASIFADSAPELINSGWADCDTPITWSTDLSRVAEADRQVAIDQMTSDLARWGEVSGLEFQFVGEVPDRVRRHELRRHERSASQRAAPVHRLPQ